jgi:hypothetical protein
MARPGAPSRKPPGHLMVVAGGSRLEAATKPTRREEPRQDYPVSMPYAASGDSLWLELWALRHRFAPLSASSSSMHASASLSPCCSSAGQREVPVHRGGPSVRHRRPDLRRACTATSPRDQPPRRTSCRAVCAMNCVCGFRRLTARKTGGGGVLLLTTSELLLVPFCEFDSRSAFLSFAHSHQCVRQPGMRSTAVEQQALQLNAKGGCACSLHTAGGAYVFRLTASGQQTGWRVQLLLGQNR